MIIVQVCANAMHHKYLSDNLDAGPKFYSCFEISHHKIAHTPCTLKQLATVDPPGGGGGGWGGVL